jgi:integrase
VFVTSRGRPQSRRNALRAIHAAGDAAGLNEGREQVGLHDLRHSFVGLALDSVSLAEASALARHKNARVTAAVYAGITDQGREQAAEKLVDAGFGR